MPKTLSLAKLQSLLLKYEYIISTIYIKQTDAYNKVIKFIETHVPATHKSFLIHIPESYVMLISEDSELKVIELTETVDASKELVITEKSVKYLMDIRGTLVESDLVAVSADGLCYTKFSGESECYFFTQNMPNFLSKDEEISIADLEEKESISEDEVLKLEKALKKVSKKQKVKLDRSLQIEEVKVEEVQVEKEEVQVEKEQVKNEGEVEIDAKIELQEGEEKEEVENVELVFHEEETPAKKKKKKKRERPDPVPITKLKLAHRINHIYPEELNVCLGLIYVSIDVNLFYKQISTFETEVLSIYEQIDDNEKDMRINKMKTIKGKFTLATKHLEDEVTRIEDEESSLKYQLLRLNNMLREIDVCDKKDETLDKICENTRKLMHELNTQLIQHKSNVNDLLTEYDETLEELIMYV